MTAQATSGTGTLTRFLLRRDRIRLPAWVAGLGLFVVYIGTALPTIAPTKQDLGAIASLFTQPVGRMFTGPAYGIDDPSYERFFAAGYAPYLYLLAALMNILLVTRHTRAEEQSGRAELLRANVTGRYSALTACLLLSLATNALTGAVVTALAIAVGYSAAGSILVGLGTGMTGLLFAGVAAMTAQVSEYPRAASGIAGMVLGGSFALRALGDMAAAGGSTLSWVSPLGWPSQTAPYVLDRWQPLLLTLALAVITIGAAYLLQARRDFGAGLLAVRHGPAHATAWLGRPLGLAARIQRSALLGWGAGILALGVIDGAFTQALVEAGENMPPILQDVLGEGGLRDGYLAFLGLFVSILIGAYTLSAMQTLRSEETRGRAEMVLATPMSRTSWLGSQVAAVTAGAMTIAVVTGLGTGIAAAIVTGEWDLVTDTVLAHLCLMPAILALLGLWAALFGWFPRLLGAVGWAWVALIAIAAIFADLLDLPEELVALSPLSHLAQVPQEKFEVVPFVTLLILAVALMVLGAAGIRRRQINVA